jgi:hypothetical protein
MTASVAQTARNVIRLKPELQYLPRRFGALADCAFFLIEQGTAGLPPR